MRSLPLNVQPWSGYGGLVRFLWPFVVAQRCQPPLPLPCREHDAAAASQQLVLCAFSSSLLTTTHSYTLRNPLPLAPQVRRRCLVRGQPLARRYQRQYPSLPSLDGILARNLQVPLAHIPYDLTRRGAHRDTSKQYTCPCRDWSAGRRRWTRGVP